MKTKNRSSNFELLRILAMLLIVCHHSMIHGVLAVQMTTPNVWKHNFIGDEIAMFGKVAVAIFVMISGYFLINSKSSRKKSISKILRLIIQVYFYSLIIYYIAVHENWVAANNVAGQQQAYLPFFFNTYWFATDYLLLYLFYPYLNQALHHLTAKQHRGLIYIEVIAFSVVPIVFQNMIDYGPYAMMLLFISYYTIGAYIRMYTLRNDPKFEWLFGLGLALIGIIIVFAYTFWMNYYGAKINNMNYIGQAFLLSGQYSFMMTIIAAGIMLWAKHWKLGNNRVINYIAATMFGVYLIHDNPIMETMIWQRWANLPAYFGRYWVIMVTQALKVSIIVFVICILIEACRLFIFNMIEWTWHVMIGKKDKEDIN